jgi:hypothetical protein
VLLIFANFFPRRVTGAERVRKWASGNCSSWLPYFPFLPARTQYASHYTASQPIFFVALRSPILVIIEGNSLIIFEFLLIPLTLGRAILNANHLSKD